MLKLPKKRITTLIILAVTLGCGKKIQGPEGLTAGKTDQVYGISGKLLMKLDESRSAFVTYQMEKDSWFKLPTTLQVQEGSGIGKKVRIFYNLAASGDYEFHCDYQSEDSETELHFNMCEGMDGRVFISHSSDLEKMEFPMDKNTSIKMELFNSSRTGVKIFSRFLVNWK